MDHKTFFAALYSQEHQNNFCLKKHKELFGPVVFFDSSRDGARIFMLCLTIRLYPLLC